MSDKQDPSPRLAAPRGVAPGPQSQPCGRLVARLSLAARRRRPVQGAFSPCARHDTIFSRRPRMARFQRLSLLAWLTAPALLAAAAACTSPTANQAITYVVPAAAAP